ncbi:MAG: hypothetical protein HC781_20185 [Leptolyngbyaceae cyanobacterium CSU_1_4]|nr:hypothetical protein [Leptolyngbyaceae cyanobacterium CSU_1_4]
MGQRQVRDMAIAPTAISLPSVENVIWQNPSGVSVNGNTLTKNTGSTLWDAGAESQQRVLSGDCAVEMTLVTATSGYYSSCAIGFSTTNPDNSLTTIGWSIGVNATDESYYTRVAGVTVPFGSAQIGDTLRVSVEGLTINFYVNTIKVRTITLTNIPSPLLVDCSIETPGSIISNARLMRGSGLTVHNPIKGKGVERSGFRLIQNKDFSRQVSILHPSASWLTVISHSILKTSINSLIEVSVDVPGFGITGGANCNAKLALFRDDDYWKPVGIAVMSLTVSEACQAISAHWMDYDATVESTYSLKIWCDRYATTNGQAAITGNAVSPYTMTLREWYRDQLY